jgi:hypothetical protein
VGVPVGNLTELWRFKVAPGNANDKGDLMGCSTNSDTTICNLREGVVALSSAGKVLWRYDAINASSNRDAVPIVSDPGATCVMDGNALAYLDGGGNKIWKQVVNDPEGSDPGFAKFAPATTADGFLPVTLGNGRMAVYSVALGLCYASLALGGDEDPNTFYTATATAATFRSRVYLTTKKVAVARSSNGSSSSSQRLYAVDATHDGMQRLQVRWNFPLPIAERDHKPAVITATMAAANIAPTVIVPAGPEGAQMPAVLFFANLPAPTLLAVEDSTVFSSADAVDKIVNNNAVAEANGAKNKNATGASLLWSQAGIAPSSLGILQEIPSCNYSITCSQYVWVYKTSTVDGAGELVRLNAKTGKHFGAIDLRGLGLGAPMSRGIVEAATPNNESNLKTRETVLVACFGGVAKSAASAAGAPVIAAVVLSSEHPRVLWTHNANATGQVLLVAATTAATTRSRPAVVYLEAGGGDVVAIG